MTEPVAYRVDGTIYNNIDEAKFAVRETEHLRNILGIDKGLIRRPKYIEPLYTAEQLHPRVKMTQAEFDEFKILKSLNPTADLIAILKTVSKFKYKNFQSRFVCGSIENQTEFATLWLRCRYERLEELIEIVPDMKWFVRSKEPEDEDEYYLFLSGSNLDDLEYFGFDYARAFDTKEGAEKWLNPLTEAVQLPVEGE
ncbi:hypothetical protein [Leuconostoc falkenbergense]|uniref:hypothetical protein n=1 Tax=Leuconostoc falkenbergense TaxID=2766470 RepID=UPI0024466114|nr:hypothetical protein [Leuconostoc falkenbergense]MDG9745752.1 hypothetical protein [Leuconostoc falkenbergense]